MRSCLSIPFLAVFLAGTLPAEPAASLDPVGQEVLTNYLEASSGQKDKLRDMSMDVEIDASLPRLKKTGKLQALRSIGKLGQITYRALSFVGDNTIKKDVIARYMSAETEAATKKDLGISEENYKFKYYGLYGEGDWQLHLFYLTPRRKEPGLFKGWLWVEANTALPVREQGQFVKSPSVFLRKVEFVRDYVIQDGIAFPSKIVSMIDTRLVGKAEVSISYSNYTRAESPDQERAAVWSASGSR